MKFGTTKAVIWRAIGPTVSKAFYAAGWRDAQQYDSTGEEDNKHQEAERRQEESFVKRDAQ